MNVFELFAKIGLDSSGFSKGLDGVMSASKVGVAAIGAVVTETAALTTALVKGVSELAEYGDHIDKQSQKMNLSAQAYQEWDAILQHSGSSIDSMQASMKTLANAVENENDAFATLGMTMEDVRGMSNEELFSKTITALQNVDNETQRTYLAGQLLGRGATELGALLNTSAEDTEKMRQRVHELGGVMSDTAVKDAAKFQDSLQDMKTSMSGMLRGIKGEFLPSFTKIMDGLTSVFAGEDGGVQKISEGIDQVFANITSATAQLKPVIEKVGGIVAKVIKENAPKLIKEGTSIFSDMLSYIVQNLPAMISTVGDVASTILSGLSKSLTAPDNLKGILSSAIMVISTLANGLIDNLPTIIESAIQVLSTLVDVFIANAPQMLESAIALMKKLGEGLVKYIREILDKVPEIMKKLKDTLNNGESIRKMFEAAAELMRKLAKGLIDNISAIREKLPQVVDSIKNFFLETNWLEVGKQILEGILSGFLDIDFSIEEYLGDFKDNFVTGIKDLFDIHSPSKVMADEVGKYLALGVGEGFSDNIGDAIPDKRTTNSYASALGRGFVSDAGMTAGGKGVHVQNLYLTVEGGRIADDYDTDRFIERVAEKLGALSSRQERAVGGTGWSY